MNLDFITYNTLADLLGVSRATVVSWEKKHLIHPITTDQGKKKLRLGSLTGFSPISAMLKSRWKEEEEVVEPFRRYESVELFAGAGGLALGLEAAGLTPILLNEKDRYAATTLQKNRPNWEVALADIRDLDFRPYQGRVDLLSGGFPCQSFSYAGKQGGFADTRGTLFFEMARAANEMKPKVILAENVKGLASHDGGKTLSIIENTIRELGYTSYTPRILKAIMYKVPQKRERLFLLAVRNDLLSTGGLDFQFPEPFYRVMTLRDAFYRGALYDTDVPPSVGAMYPAKKQEILERVPMGGDWRDLPIAVQKEYMGGSYLLGGGKTGMARRLSLEEPSLTLTCSPAQKQTERCHPLETRPLTVREYARVQTFPDEWIFYGSLSEQYKQIGNAVPVNLAAAVGRSVVRFLNALEAKKEERKGHLIQTPISLTL